LGDILSGNLYSSFEIETNSPPWWLKSGHLQTIFAQICSSRPEIQYRRERWDTPDGDFLDIDFVDGDPKAPWVIALHGLEGCSYSRYILRLMSCLQVLRWNGAVYNFRGCGGEVNRLIRSYHSGDTDDLAFVVNNIQKRMNNQPLFLVGYSLGGNVIAKWLGELGHDAVEKIWGASLNCAPFELTACQVNMDRGINRLYVWKFLRTLRKKAMQRLNSNSHNIDIKRAMRALTIRDFDDAFTAPAHGFRDYLHYYTDSSSMPYLKQIEVPTLILHAWDDPIIPAASFPNQANINGTVVLRALQHGGHVCFYDKTFGSYWLDRQILRWFHLLLSERGSCLAL